MAGQAVRGLNRLFIGNLPWTVGHQELTEYFSSFGNVKLAKVIFDRSSGLSRGYGFVSYVSKNGYDNAANKPVHKLEGSVITVNPASS